MLKADILYSYYPLKNPVTIAGTLVQEAYIDPYYQKHNQEFLTAKKEKGIKLSQAELAKRLITDNWIIEFVQTLDQKELGKGKRYSTWVYYPFEPLWKHHRSYCLIFCLEDGKNYIEIIDCYRESKYERKKWKNKYEASE